MLFEPNNAYIRLMTYNWQQEDWPNFTYDPKRIEEVLFMFAEQAGRISGMEGALPEGDKMDIIVATMVAEAVKTSEIESEYISRQDVMSSIRCHLGLDQQQPHVKDSRVVGISELMLDVRNSYKEVLSEKRLMSWHKMLMKGNQYIRAGKWRSGDEPMQVVSGAAGREKIHFEAPPSQRVPSEMKRFIQWFNKVNSKDIQGLRHAPVRAAIAHLYFESIHPFEDGNGRIGRAIAEKALSQNMGGPLVISLSRSIESFRKQYYNALKSAQQSNEITEWVLYFISLLMDALNLAENQINFIFKKTRFFDQFEGRLNDRQLKVVRKMLENGPGDFKGGMNARKYISITRASKATATRDLQDLLEKGAFEVSGGGRSTSYQVVV